MTDDRIAALSATPAPSDQEASSAIRGEASFLCDRLREFERDLLDDEAGNQYYGHVTPSLERLEALLDAPSDQDASQAQGEVATMVLHLRNRADSRDQMGYDATAEQLRAAADMIERLAALSPAPGATAQDGVDWAAVGREYAAKALSGGIPQVRAPQYALSGTLTAMAQEIERLRATPTPTIPAGMVADADCRFADCPPGLFRWAGLLCFKSEYSTKSGQPDAYCVDSGEYFWGGTNGDLEKRLNLTVTPITAAPKQAEQQGVERGSLNAAIDAIQAAEGALARAAGRYPDVGACAIRGVIDVERGNLRRSRQHVHSALATDPHQHGGKGA